MSREYENVEGYWVEEGDKVLYISSLYTDKKDVYQGLMQYTISSGKLETSSRWRIRNFSSNSPLV